ncbi:MAG: hypothetical protein ACYDHG_06890 [Desulfomonilaceae bacterium]
MRGSSVKTLMVSLTMVIVEIGIESVRGFSHGFISAQINFLIFDTFPCSFNNDVVNPSAFSIHAYFDPIRN